MTRLLRFALNALLPFLLPVSAAFAQSDPQALNWLQRIHSATQKLSYTGTFFYQNGEQTETSRITRHVSAEGPQEKLESLSGLQREIIRSRNQVTCYLPESKTVRIDKKVVDRSFPAILPGQVKGLAANYVIRRGAVERVAGFDCQVIVLTPKDKMRYGHKLWADVVTGMLLKAKTFDGRSNAVEAFEFVQLEIGNIDRDKVKSRFATSGSDWRVEDAKTTDANLLNAGWVLRSPPGFRKIGEMRRTLGGIPGVAHFVLSDGLAAVSVFIEPLTNRRASPSFARQGAINIYTRRLGEHWITVVGETPVESVKFVADAIEYRKPRK